MINIIEIKGIQCYSYHGCMPEETKTGGKYLVDVIIHYNFEKAADTDNLNETIDYCRIYDVVQKEMSVPSKLIESVAKRIAFKCKEQYNNIENIQIKVIKLSPPISGLVEHVAVTYSI